MSVRDWLELGALFLAVGAVVWAGGGISRQVSDHGGDLELERAARIEADKEVEQRLKEQIAGVEGRITERVSGNETRLLSIDDKLAERGTLVAGNEGDHREFRRRLDEQGRDIERLEDRWTRRSDGGSTSSDRSR